MPIWGERLLGSCNKVVPCAEDTTSYTCGQMKRQSQNAQQARILAEKGGAVKTFGWLNFQWVERDQWATVAELTMSFTCFSRDRI